MSEHSFFKRNWRLIVNVATIVALVVLVFLIRDQIVETYQHLDEVNLWILSLMLPLTILGYHAQTRLYLDLFRLLGNKISYKFMFRAAVELNFVNSVFPSGGVSGISYFGVRMRSVDITGTKASLVQILKLLLLFISFEVLLIIGLISMALSGQANDLIILVAGSISTLLAVGTVAFVMIVGSERRIHATFTAITTFLNRVVRFFRPRRPDAISTARAERIVKDLHDNFQVVQNNYRALRAPLLWALVVNISAVLTIYVVYISFGSWVNIGAVILAYSVANFAGLVSVLPGGVGIYEALMTGVLAAAGIPAALSLPVTIMYRVFSTLIQVPPGWYLYHQAVRGGDDELKPDTLKS